MKIPTRIAFSVLFCFIILSKSNFLAKAQNTRISVNVGVILDFDTWTAKMGLSCINMALADFYASNSHYKTRLLLSSRDSKSDVVEAAAADFYASNSHYKTRLLLSSRDSKSDVVEAAAAALDLIKNLEVQAIIGPENSMQAKFIIDLGEKAQVPIVAFSATSPSLTSLRSPYFFQAAQSSSSQVKAISEFVQAYGWREVVPIYIDNEYGQDDYIGEELFKLMTMQTRVFIVHMPIDLGSRLFTKAKEIGMMSEGYVWIITSGMTDSIRSIESLARDSMQGVLGVKTYVPKTIELENFTLRWKTKFHQDNPNILDVELNVRGLWAYDAASALARAVENAGTTNFGFENSTASQHLTDLATMGKFDAVAGDTTIIANRTNYIDFTLPYTESGVTMVVPIKDNERKNAWVFLKPLTWDLWITSGLFFVFIGFVVWVLEHRVNEEFRGPPSHEIGTSLWYSFSTMNGEYVGYQEGSYVLGILQEMKFDSSKLGTYKSAEECDDLFSKGSANGGIAAAFDDIPCMKSLLSQYCSKYTMVHSIYKTDGFGFVFPKGSPFVSDVSWAVLNVIEGEQMKEIEKKWLGDQSDCPSSSTQVSSGSLSLESFWGLFLIAGIASLSALIISFSVFLYKERQQIWIRFDSKNSIWRRICHALTIFDNKDLSSHTFRNKALKDRDDIDYVDDTT
ncbi:glutamate receptor 2.2 [Quercus suber]|uniref:Glutamate receptor 2.2 n=1 Tax=Quercus suber TaxID=58331 RepID=A0AAW0KWK2_QUESU